MPNKGQRQTTAGPVSALGFALVALALGVNPAGAETRPAAANLYFKGPILTMEGDQPEYVEALVEQDGLIAFAGPLREARKRFAGATGRNLQGQTLVPGFIDGHGHIYLTGWLLSMANVFPEPDGTVKDFDGLVEVTRKWMASETGKQFIKTYGWVLANGYDHTMLREGRHPTADVLDRISTEYPVLVLHQSGHMASANHKGLQLAGLSKNTIDPPGGVIQRAADGAPNGVLEESAVTLVGSPILTRTTPEIDAMAIANGQDLYVSYGYTTAEEARAYPPVSAALAQAAKDKRFRIDVISYPDVVANTKAMDTEYWRADRAYSNRYRIGGAKISLDGAVQGKTAWLTHPYFIKPPHAVADYAGYAAMSDSKAEGYFKLAASKGWQIACHANGDAAIDQCLNSIEAAQKAFADADHRSVVIHGQTMRADQVRRVKALGALPTFFAAHTFYWGDYHRESSLGSPRAERISPTREALNAGLTLTTHHDSPVIMPNAMRIVHATVNRTTRSGKVLGPEQRLTPYEALKAVTIWGAIQHFEEQKKGTLSVGKRADFAVLSDNPVKITPALIKSIRVTATIKDGKAVYCQPEPARTAICN